jgi:hypothetical protein
MVAKKHATPVDAGLQQIADWATWFRDAHAQRLRDLGLAPDAVAREFAPILAQADAIEAQLRVEHLANRARSAQP